VKIDVTADGRVVRFHKHEVKELRKGSKMLSMVAVSLPGSLSPEIVDGVAEFVGRIGDDGKYAEPAPTAEAGK
jgi:hypothetical protein